MVQRGQELGLLQLNSTLRNNMRMALIESIIAENASATPDENELRALYDNDRAFFSRPERIRLQVMKFDSEEKAKQARLALQKNKDFLTVKKDYALEDIIELPRGWLSVTELRNYIGPTLTLKALELETNTISKIINNQDGWYVIKLIDIEKAKAPPYEEITEVVRSEFIRRQNSKTIEEYLDYLRSRASIETIPVLPM